MKKTSTAEKAQQAYNAYRKQDRKCRTMEAEHARLTRKMNKQIEDCLWSAAGETKAMIEDKERALSTEYRQLMKHRNEWLHATVKSMKGGRP